MSRNYVAIHYIQSQLSAFNSSFVDCVVRCFNIIEQSKEPNGCLSNSIALFICAKEYGYNPILCYGLCTFESRSFYHAWLEIDDIVIDMAIYGNVNFSPYSMWTDKLAIPYVGTYANSFIHYGRFVFDDDWSGSDIAMAENWSFDYYMNLLPCDAMWRIVCKFLDKTFSASLIEHLRMLIIGESIRCLS